MQYNNIMKKSIKILIISLFVLNVCLSTSYAGNEQRIGSAGATELLINPWARSSGFAGANSASIRGLEAMYSNVAGTAFVNNAEFIFSHTTYLSGTDININSFGLSKKVGETGVLSLSVMSMDFGENLITTVFNPEGLGTFSPSLTNIGVSFAKAFSNSIYGGIAVKVINQKITDLSTAGVALDAGIQYVTGKNKQIKFGIALKNVGPTMKFTGDGMSYRGFRNDMSQTIEQRSAAFELPSLIKIGVAYDLNFNEENILQVAGNFTSNSFTRDQFHGGLEYNFKNILFIRGGYVYEKGGSEVKETFITGPTAGMSVQIPLKKESGSVFSLEYSYRDTNPYSGIHSIGAKVSL